MLTARFNFGLHDEWLTLLSSRCRACCFFFISVSSVLQLLLVFSLRFAIFQVPSFPSSYFKVHSKPVMASLITNSNTHTSRSTRHLAPSPHLRMPHVFVIPPEEEQQDNPPWCCFDADEQQGNNRNFHSNRDFHFFDVPYLLQPSEHGVPAPIPRLTSVHQPRPRAPVTKKLEKKQRPEAVKIIENWSSQTTQKDARVDSDVIEVVKVKRTREALTDLEENTKIKRSKTFKARATKALQSIKNVGKGSHRTHVKELWTSNESMPGIFKGVQEQIRSQQERTEHRPPTTVFKKGSLSRASSLSLSQIFQSVKPPQPESTLTVRVETSVTLAETDHIPPATNTSSFPCLKYNNTNPFLTEVSGVVTPDDSSSRPVSPGASKKNTGTKFSVRELHRLFSFSSSSTDDLPPATIAATAPSSPHSSSMPPTSTCTLPSDCPDVPMDQDVHVDAHFLNLASADRKLASRCHQILGIHHADDLSTPHRLSNLSFEMKLDSLHFDALSFDPEDFDLSMEGNVLR